jgi:hypothetical protein
MTLGLKVMEVSLTHSSLGFLITTCTFLNKFGFEAGHPPNAHLGRKRRAEDGARGFLNWLDLGRPPSAVKL